MPLTCLIIGIGLGAMSVFADRPGTPRVVLLAANLTFPWALGALIVGRMTASPKRGALAGGATLLVGMATFYLTIPDAYIRSARDVIWTASAVVVGPVLGWCGAVATRDRERTHSLALVIPSGVLLAETIWVTLERRFWLWDLGAEPYRWNDVALLVAVAALALALPRILGRRRDLIVVYVWILAAGVVGAVGFKALKAILLLV